MLVRVRDHLGNTISIEDASESWTIAQLKTAIYWKTQINVERMRLLHMGQEISSNDDLTLQEWNITNRNVIVLIERPTREEADEGQDASVGLLAESDSSMISLEIELLRDCLKHSIQVRRNCILMFIVTVISSVQFPMLLALTFISFFGYSAAKRFNGCLTVPFAVMQLGWCAGLSSVGLSYGLPSWMPMVLLLWSATAFYDSTMLFLSCRQVDQVQWQFLLTQNDQLDVLRLLCADVDNTVLVVR
eukprot:TRINITY_DN4796_c0_g1_i1.p1 TRINITY_DN4796_c0_g1~~TRINITY_DN4796_c0_g1_i1.p1  ORF type:complete len:246 (-),score=51.49 TRINITY_DN4796_c0_g1_i1:12-749(-)